MCVIVRASGSSVVAKFSGWGNNVELVVVGFGKAIGEASALLVHVSVSAWENSAIVSWQMSVNKRNNALLNFFFLNWI